jgi:EpsI family protein
VSGWRVLVVCGTIAAYIAGVQVFAGSAVTPARPLHDLPFQIGGWSGRAVPADPVLLERAQPDAAVHRRYVGMQGRPVFLYVGYYARQASRGQGLTVCWGRCTIVHRDVVTLVVSGELAQINRAKVIMNGMPMMVAFWFQRGRTIIADPYRNKMEQIRTGFISRRSNGAVVRIAAPVMGDDVTAWTDLLSFVRSAQPHLLGLLPE